MCEASRRPDARETGQPGDGIPGSLCFRRQRNGINTFPVPAVRRGAGTHCKSADFQRNRSAGSEYTQFKSFRILAAVAPYRGGFRPVQRPSYDGPAPFDRNQIRRNMFFAPHPHAGTQPGHPRIRRKIVGKLKPAVFKFQFHAIQFHGISQCLVGRPGVETPHLRFIRTLSCRRFLYPHRRTAGWSPRNPGRRRTGSGKPFAHGPFSRRTGRRQ